nr:tRNA_CCA_actino: CCA tRNA [uncultured bacterium]
MNAAARGRIGEDREDLLVALSVLCHDLGKPATTRLVDGRIRALGHDEAGIAPTRSFLGRITAEPALIEAIVDLVREHLRPSQFFQSGAGDPAIRRLATRVPIEILVRVARADHLGRSTREATERRYPAGDWLLGRARALSVARSGPPPLLSGRHLVACGLEPGPDFRDLLRRAYEAQLDGRVSSVEEALEYLGVGSKS